MIRRWLIVIIFLITIQTVHADSSPYIHPGAVDTLQGVIVVDPPAHAVKSLYRCTFYCMVKGYDPRIEDPETTQRPDPPHLSKLNSMSVCATSNTTAEAPPIEECKKDKDNTGEAYEIECTHTGEPC